jgi:hypothetical protein
MRQGQRNSQPPSSPRRPIVAILAGTIAVAAVSVVFAIHPWTRPSKAVSHLTAITPRHTQSATPVAAGPNPCNLTGTPLIKIAGVAVSTDPATLQQIILPSPGASVTIASELTSTNTRLDSFAAYVVPSDKDYSNEVRLKGSDAAAVLAWARGTSTDGISASISLPIDNGLKSGSDYAVIFVFDSKVEFSGAKPAECSLPNGADHQTITVMSARVS